MNSCHALVPVRNRSIHAHSGLPMFDQSVNRFVIEQLEARVLFDATAATVTIDPTFATTGPVIPLPPPMGGYGGDSYGAYTKITPTADGKTYVVGGGHDTFPTGFESIDIVRLNADGSTDPTFNTQRTQNLGVWHGWYGDIDMPVYDSLLVGSLIVQQDGKVVVAIRDVPWQSPDPVLLIRYNTDGSFDPTFGSGGIVTIPIDQTGQGNPQVWMTVAGKFDYLDVTWWRGAEQPMLATIKQFNADGSPDLTFGESGQVVTPLVSDMAADPLSVEQRTNDLGYVSPAYWWTRLFQVQPQPDGGVITYVSESCSQPYGWTADCNQLDQLRFGAAGNLVSRKMVGQSADDWANAFTLPDGGALVINGNSGTDQVLLHRITPDGDPDANFAGGGSVGLLPSGMRGGAHVSSVDLDGKILVELRDYRGMIDAIQRLNPDGSPDTSFAGGQPVFGFGDREFLGDTATLSDGSILVGVSHQTWWDTTPQPSTRIVKLVPYGGIPGTFDFKAVDDAKNPPPPQYTGGDGSSDDDSGDTVSGDGGNDETTTDDESDGVDGLNLYDDDTDHWADGDDQGFFDDPDDATFFDPNGTNPLT
jgi:uncharacterized delta-60 repeat protein